MKRAPEVKLTTSKAPPLHGPGSGKEAWVTCAHQVIEANERLSATLERQAAVIRDLEAEVKLLREQVASRKPKGGRERLPDDVIEHMERALEAGHSTRQIGKAYGVSAMTASRVRKRMAERAIVVKGTA